MDQRSMATTVQLVQPAATGSCASISPSTKAPHRTFTMLTPLVGGEFAASQIMIEEASLRYGEPNSSQTTAVSRSCPASVSSSCLQGEALPAMAMTTAAYSAAASTDTAAWYDITMSSQAMQEGGSVVPPSCSSEQKGGNQGAGGGGHGFYAECLLPPERAAGSSTDCYVPMNVREGDAEILTHQGNTQDGGLPRYLLQQKNDDMFLSPMASQGSLGSDNTSTAASCHANTPTFTTGMWAQPMTAHCTGVNLGRTGDAFGSSPRPFGSSPFQPSAGLSPPTTVSYHNGLSGTMGPGYDGQPVQEQQLLQVASRGPTGAISVYGGTSRVAGPPDLHGTTQSPAAGSSLMGALSMATTPATFPQAVVGAGAVACSMSVHSSDPYCDNLMSSTQKTSSAAHPHLVQMLATSFKNDPQLPGQPSPSNCHLPVSFPPPNHHTQAWSPESVIKLRGHPLSGTTDGRPAPCAALRSHASCQAHEANQHKLPSLLGRSTQHCGLPSEGHHGSVLCGAGSSSVAVAGSSSEVLQRSPPQGTGSSWALHRSLSYTPQSEASLLCCYGCNGSPPTAESPGLELVRSASVSTPRGSGGIGVSTGGSTSETYGSPTSFSSGSMHPLLQNPLDLDQRDGSYSAPAAATTASTAATVDAAGGRPPRSAFSSDKDMDLASPSSPASCKAKEATQAATKVSYSTLLLHSPTQSVPERNISASGFAHVSMSDTMEQEIHTPPLAPCRLTGTSGNYVSPKSTQQFVTGSPDSRELDKGVMPPPVKPPSPKALSTSLVKMKKGRNNPGPQVKSQRLTSEQVRALEEVFETTPHISIQMREQIAEKLKVKSRQVMVWFQNRRMRASSRQMEDKYETLVVQHKALSSDYELLKRDYRQLLHENLELKNNVNSALPPSPTEHHRGDSAGIILCRPSMAPCAERPHPQDLQCPISGGSNHPLSSVRAQCDFGSSSLSFMQSVPLHREECQAQETKSQLSSMSFCHTDEGRPLGDMRHTMPVFADSEVMLGNRAHQTSSAYQENGAKPVLRSSDDDVGAKDASGSNQESSLQAKRSPSQELSMRSSFADMMNLFYQMDD